MKHFNIGNLAETIENMKEMVLVPIDADLFVDGYDTTETEGNRIIEVAGSRLREISSCNWEGEAIVSSLQRFSNRRFKGLRKGKDELT